MKTENKIIVSFLKYSIPKTIRELSKYINSDYRITYIAVKKLIEKNILNSKTIGKSTLCELNKSYYGLEIYEAENNRKQDLLKNKDINQLQKEIMQKAITSFFIMIIFGSYAKEKSAKSSDIDLMFISNEKGFEEKITSILSLLPLNTHSLVFTEEEFIRMKDAKDSNVVKEAIKNNIILYNIECFYRLKNV